MIGPARMAAETTCGPVAVLNALLSLRGNMPPGQPVFTVPTFEELLQKWRWPEGDGWKNNLRDGPGDHFAIFRHLGVRYRRATCGEILEGRAPAGRTIFLYHYADDPKTWEPEHLTYQHWVRFLGKQMGHGAGPQYLFDWGRGTRPVILLTDDVTGGYSRGSPACAYVIGEDETSRSGRVMNWLAWRWHQVVRTLF